MRRSVANVAPRVLAALAALVLAVGAAGCAPRDKNPGAEPAVEGVVADVVTDEGGTVAFTLSGLDTGDYFFDARIAIGPDTTVTDAEGNELESSAVADGVVVEVWTDRCAETYPVQCVATAVRLGLES